MIARRATACGAALAAALLASCSKVPIHDVAAGFTLADVSWFAEEETLFVFYDLSAQQGLGDASVLEITYTTDDAVVDWTALADLEPVHGHEPVDCGTTSLCGSWSVHVEKEPRDVALRLRYHRDGEMSLDADTVFNVVGPGDPWSHRSYLVYGVFDETNRRVQWRGRHRFPTLRNEQATDYGLRRDLLVEDATYGSAVLATPDNVYGYGVECPAGFDAAGLSAVETDERAVFAGEDLPIEASDAALVCAQATVTDAKGSFTTGAIARKNPEVRPAFPELRSPIRDAALLPFFLEPCDRVISADHEDMQRQRLQIGALASTCTDDWDAPGFADALAVRFSDAIEAARPEGRDMVLLVGLHRDEDGVSDVLQEALAQVVPEERLRASPRLAGAFVFDSDADGPSLPELDASTLWCPSTVTDTDNSLANMTCAIAPDNPSVELGPFSFGTLPILPSREQYLEFVETYSEAQAGEVTGMSIRAPEFATTADHVAIGDYGVATFLNDELVTAGEDDAFSYCVNEDPAIVVFRSEFMRSEAFLRLVQRGCETGTVDEELCAWAGLGLLPLALLPEWHATFPEDSYALGLFWDFPFLLHLDYETSAAGSVTAFGFSVPFGVAATGESYLGTAMWTTDTVSLEETITQCTRFCGHPTFDSAGVYQVSAPFDPSYATSCYLPAYPELGDSGFPLDP
ncbi:MAG: hypothetical protein ACOZNI_21915 [Myxococcota bacterium]